ncbi:hypothetical protein G9A89_001366 [Geosiphon pyriformis]|nr:hypothetical protein G9A89_001366 [Geosiphon pyriformis]
MSAFDDQILCGMLIPERWDLPDLIEDIKGYIHTICCNTKIMPSRILAVVVKPEMLIKKVLVDLPDLYLEFRAKIWKTMIEASFPLAKGWSRIVWTAKLCKELGTLKMVDFMQKQGPIGRDANFTLDLSWNS